MDPTTIGRKHALRSLNVWGIASLRAVPMKTIVLWGVLVDASAFATTPPLTLKGLDPVSLTEGKEVPGRAGLRTQYGKFSYAFTSKAHQQSHQRDQHRPRTAAPSHIGAAEPGVVQR